MGGEEARRGSLKTRRRAAQGACSRPGATRRSSPGACNLRGGSESRLPPRSMLNRESSESTRESPTRLTTTFHRKLNAPRRTVFRLITDYEKLQETFPQIFLSFRVLERSRGEVVTEEKVFMVGVTMTHLCRHMTKSQTTHIVRIMTGDLGRKHDCRALLLGFRRRDDRPRRGRFRAGRVAVIASNVRRPATHRKQRGTSLRRIGRRARNWR